jgi:hypothetical protein
MSFLKAMITLEDEFLPHIVCHFAPETLTISKTNMWNARGGVGQALASPIFQKGNPATLSMKLLFDATELPGRDVKGDAEKLLKLMNAGEHRNASLPGRQSSNSAQKRPPIITFSWGAILSFKCVVQKVKVDFLLFDDSGRPLRATADVTFQQVKLDNDFSFQNPTSGGRTGERIHRLAPAETLDQVAYSAFGKTSLWRAIAAFNGIDDPLRLQAGDEILLPPSADDLQEFA